MAWLLRVGHFLDPDGENRAPPSGSQGQNGSQGQSGSKGSGQGQSGNKGSGQGPIVNKGPSQGPIVNKGTGQGPTVNMGTGQGQSNNKGPAAGQTPKTTPYVVPPPPDARVPLTYETASADDGTARAWLGRGRSHRGAPRTDPTRRPMTPAPTPLHKRQPEAQKPGAVGPATSPVGSSSGAARPANWSAARAPAPLVQARGTNHADNDDDDDDEEEEEDDDYGLHTGRTACAPTQTLGSPPSCPN